MIEFSFDCNHDHFVTHSPLSVLNCLPRFVVIKSHTQIYSFQHGAPPVDDDAIGKKLETGGMQVLKDDISRTNWSDIRKTGTVDKHIQSARGGTIKDVSYSYVQQFLSQNNIDYNISGHQDYHTHTLFVDPENSLYTTQSNYDDYPFVFNASKAGKTFVYDATKHNVQIISTAAVCRPDIKSASYLCIDAMYARSVLANHVTRITLLVEGMTKQFQENARFISEKGKEPILYTREQSVMGAGMSYYFKCDDEGCTTAYDESFLE